ncbi:MAG: M13 family metallopeptidase [Gemmatimonadota bacterium]|nr:M13 family metallopeptidase [Gemmatimonadota bacterium]
MAAMLTIALAAVLAWPHPPAALAQASAGHGTSKLEAGVDSTIKPGDDFFAYANGSWIKATTIPAGKERWTARDEINIVVSKRIVKLLDDARNAPPGSTPRKVADFRTAYLDESAIEAKGITPLQPLLDSIDRIQDRTALTRMLGSSMRADVDPLNWGVYKSSNVLGLSVEESIHGEKDYVAFLVQGGLGLPDRENYISTEPAKRALRDKYQLYVGRQLALANFDRADQRSAAVMSLETAIAQTQATQDASALDHNADHRWTRADFAHDAPGMDWTAYFDAAGLAKQDAFVAWQPSAVTGLAALVASQPLATWRDYLRFHAIDRYADVLPRAFAAGALAMRAAEQSSQAPDSTRAQRALAATQVAMSGAIGMMYSERFFPSAQKAHVQAIIANVAAAFARRVEAVTWMSPDTKKIALAKVKALYVGIGYPDTWEDYSDLTMNPKDAIGNVRRIADRNYRHTLARLGTAIRTNEWWITPQTVGAILIFQQNSYEFTAALLQAPKFDPTESDAANYGSIGANLGHDVTHFVDVLGADYDLDGAMRNWRTPEDTMHFAAVAEPLVNQFSSYKPLPDASVNGKLTETENIADLGGITSAFDAYRLSLGSRVNDKAYVHQQDREFFLAWAQSWRMRMSEAGMRKQLANDHAPEMYRIATVRNLDAWYDAFDVRPGDRLYLEPVARVHIW